MHRRRTGALLAVMPLAMVACVESSPTPESNPLPIFAGSNDYCAVPDFDLDVLAHVPGPGSTPVDDVNWFARPVPHDGDDWIIAFASHDQNYLYNLSEDRRVMIPDRSDAVATPDGRYMTVPLVLHPRLDDPLLSGRPHARRIGGRP